MTVASPSVRLPLVLLVENEPDSLRKRRKLFESFGCTALSAPSSSEAIQELGRTPLVDLVVTDVHMPKPGESDPDDDSGVTLARYVKQNFAGIPVAGYSAHFEVSELPTADWDVFDIAFPKGRLSVRVMQQQVERCVRMAIERRDQRLAAREEKLDELRREYEAVAPEFEVLRRLALDSSDLAASAMVEGPLGDAGYRLRLVARSAPTGPTDPFIVWCCMDVEGTYVEVYGYPALYAFGESEAKAIDSLGELMWLYRQDESAGTAPSSPGVAALLAFLERVFTNSRGSD